ncbi:hypothetical protein ND861_02805 [Leptospira sp. 2 VSF19]|uniref:Uncharacterized protein n=1 Tax=Leptospira soteropolitanensis TaxID=2950025 RepID=A0AAW5V9N0_9LEPT|nr:hypothetical protein [Leptospira soteropolitanensis]MCW7491575.1 hypothetical protein [Leptospira soteropolitanensis]MCW7499159.1 hypothetical protein [Leptospira soteropolitanensis]MCW7521249.1 hypothetical protein [Leptospira soteropolitanensis]MCW7525263.1 hypothetical protein [Leptospira soteropolitanensis]MCW7529130.1 hypothetical protein [Leptospira soteropolitanensis]
MKIQDYKSINRILNETSAKNKPGDIYVDNLHTPYIQFPEKFVISGTSVTQPEFGDIKDFVHTILKYIPEAIEGTCLLPEPRPKRETGKLFFVRPMLFGSSRFLYVFSVDMLYLGGAGSEEIKKPGSQNMTPSIITDRLYFQTKIIHLHSTKEDGENITDFEAKRFQGGVFRVESERDDSKPIRKFSEIFDEIDFSDTESKIREELGITADVWKLGRIYSPIGIDYLSLSLRFLIPSLPKTIQQFRNFYPILTQTESGIPDETLKKYHKYLSSFDVERTQSKSGNILWKVLQKSSDN